LLATTSVLICKRATFGFAGNIIYIIPSVFAVPFQNVAVLFLVDKELAALETNTLAYFYDFFKMLHEEDGTR